MDFDDEKVQTKQPERRSQQTSPPSPLVKTKWHTKIADKFSRKKIIAIAAITLILVIALVSTVVSQYPLTAAGDKPSFTTILPSGKSVGSLGGWKRVSPPDAEAVFAYQDSIDTVDILVSQQVLPKDFKESPEKSLAEMAKKFNATNQVPGTAAYIGTSAKGPQSVLLIKGKVLIMIKSEQYISPSSWTAYIQSLR